MTGTVTATILPTGTVSTWHLTATVSVTVSPTVAGVFTATVAPLGSTGPEAAIAITGTGSLAAAVIPPPGDPVPIHGGLAVTVSIPSLPPLAFTSAITATASSTQTASFVAGLAPSAMPTATLTLAGTASATAHATNTARLSLTLSPVAGSAPGELPPFLAPLATPDLTIQLAATVSVTAADSTFFLFPGPSVR
ncbi:MAG: hypothetical protein KatS3mg050_4083 [Litorilinea sp.]|nr:MAG: hypothetical protein KatS3mg050_4083 [Litorilinea sp.]